MSDRLRFVGPMERALFLKTMPFFDQLPISELAVLSGHLRERFFRGGSTLLRDGEPVGRMYIIVEGEVRARRGGHPYDFTAGPGEAIGFLSFLARSEKGVAAVAEVDTLTLEMDTDTITDVYEDRFTLLHYLMKKLATRTLLHRMKTPDGTYFGRGEPIVPYRDRPLDLVERLILMRSGPVFKDANLDAMAQLIQQMREMRFEAGTRLWNAGDRAASLYMIISGTIACSIKDGERRFRCGPGYPLGNVEAMARYPRWYDAVTETPVIALEGENERFLDHLEDHFEMAMDLVAGMAAGVLQITLEEHEQNHELSAAGQAAFPR